MIEQNNRPFVGKPVKLAYMWRDLERRAHRHGVPFVSVPNYPNDPDELANRVATLSCRPGTEWRDVHRAASLVLAEGLVSFGLLFGEPESLRCAYFPLQIRARVIAKFC